MRSSWLPVLAVVSSACVLVACRRDSSGGDHGGLHTTIDDRDEHAVERSDEAALLARARNSPECGVVEPMGCDDPQIVKVRCELAERAAKQRWIYDELLTDARTGDRRRRGAALRVLADSNSEDAVRVVHEALFDNDPTISCRAAAYGLYFKREDAARLDDLAKSCEDGKPVITQTAELVKLGAPGALVKTGVTCEDLRNAAQ